MEEHEGHASNNPGVAPLPSRQFLSQAEAVHDVSMEMVMDP